MTTKWDSGFPLASVKRLDRIPSDHNPLVLETGSNVFFGKKRFRFEKWWLYQEGFSDIVEKAWNTPCNLTNSLDRWQFKIRALRRFVRGWAMNEVARLNKYKNDLSLEYNDLEAELDSRVLSISKKDRLNIVSKELEKI